MHKYTGNQAILCPAFFALINDLIGSSEIDQFVNLTSG